jgi:hypothetical protein
MLRDFKTFGIFFFLIIMEFSIDALAEIINGLAVNLISAAMIFWYIWFTRKKPTVVINVIGPKLNPNDINLNFERNDYWFELEVETKNDSIYNLFNYEYKLINFPFSNYTIKNPVSYNIPANETDHMYIELKLHYETPKLLSDIISQDVMNWRGMKFEISYRNEENRKFTKIITPTFREQI